MAKYIANAQKRWVRGIQTRIDVTASMLGSMKVSAQFKDAWSELLTTIAGSENAWSDGCSQQHGPESACQRIGPVQEVPQTHVLASLLP